jgi:hypothetical protein
MAKQDNYFQFPIYLLDGDMHEICNWAVGYTAHAIGSKIHKDGYSDVFLTDEAIERGCDELSSVQYSEALVSRFDDATEKLAEMTSRYGAPPLCRVREDLFVDAMKRKPSITENYFRVFAAMTAILGGSRFKRITRERLHAGACGWKSSELPDGWEHRVKFGMMQKITKGLAKKSLCSSYWDNVGCRTTWYSIKMRPEELAGAVKNTKLKRRKIPAACAEEFLVDSCLEAF